MMKICLLMKIQLLKKIDDTNIDYVIDTLLTACPEVSQRYLKIVREMLSNEKR